MNNKELREKQKQEAIKRLELLQKEYMIHKNVLKEFKENETIYYSENFAGIFKGILYWLRNKQEYMDIVKELEEKRNVYVYHCILNHYKDVGDILTMLFVSADEKNWQDEREKIEDGYVNSYVYNFNFILDSGFHYIEITGVNGGLDVVD